VETGRLYELRGISAAQYTVGFISSGLGVEIGRGKIAGSYFINFGISGELNSARGDERVVNDRRTAAVFNPGDPQLLVPSDQGTETLGIRLDRELVEHELAALLGRPADAPVRFDLALDLTQGPASGLGLVVETMVNNLDSGHHLFAHPAVQLGYVRSVVTSLLVSQRHNFSELLHEGHAPVRPRNLRRAMDFIEENLAEPITLGDIAVAAGCSARTLNDAFREHLSTSPMTYVRDLRLERVREELKVSDDLISTVAYRWGFTHLGRFAGLYHQRFNERPSVTARKH